MKAHAIFLSAILGCMAGRASTATTYTETVDGITWTYTISDGKASTGGGSNNQPQPAVSTNLTGTLTIPSQFRGCPVTKIGRCSFENCSALDSIIIPETVLSIESDAFLNASKLFSIVIPDSVTSIEQGAFQNCSRMYSVLIGTGVRRIGYAAFQNCTGLAEVRIKDLTAWLSIDFVSDNSNPLQHAHHIFLNDSEIVNLVIPDGIQCIPDQAFRSGTGIQSVVIPDSVTSIGRYAFSGCSSIWTVHLSEHLISIGHRAFGDCTSLRSIRFPDSLQRIENNAFICCYALNTIEFGNGLESLFEGAFYQCSGISHLVLPNSLKSLGADAFRLCNNLQSIRIGNSVSAIGDEAFFKCSKLASLFVPVSVQGIGDDAFSGCKSLSVIYLPEALQGRESAYGLPSSCRIVWHNGSFDLDVASAMGAPVPAVGTTAFEPGQTVSCAVQKTIPDPDHENVSYECTGWTGTGSVPSVGTGTNVSFVIEMNSSIAWNWRTNVNVFGDGKPLEWTDSGDAGWTAALGGPDAGHEDCLRSGAVSQGQTSVRETTVVGPGTLSFDWKISANRADFGRFLVDGATNTSITKATSWATVTQPIPSGTHTLRWIYERNSTTPAGDDGLFLDNVVWRPVLSLAVSSAYGTAVPATGTTQYGYNDQVSARVAAPAAANGTRRVCTGWTGTGSVPASGTATNVSFRITENSTLRWNWRTDYWIELGKSGNVSPSFTSAWVKQGNTVTVTWPDPGASTVVRVSGDTDGTTFDEAGRTLVIPADRPRSLSLAATTLTLADALDETKPLWSTGAIAPWTPQGSVTKAGEDAAIAAAIGGGAVSVLEAAVEGPGTFAWSWKLDRGDLTGIDVLVDGTLAESLSAAGAWSTASATVSGTGTHVVRFEYWNESGSTANRGYLDCVSWSGSSPGESVWYVDAATGDDSNGGLSPETALKTIQAAFDVAETGGNVVVADGVYTGSANAYSAIRNMKNKTLSFRSVNGAERTIIDGGGRRRCIEGATKQEGQTGYIHETYRHLVTMDGFTFRNGNCQAGGGAVLTATLKNCIVTGNTTRRRGAVSEVNLENCLIAGNAAWNDTKESIAPSAASKCTLVNCTVVANTNMTSLGAVAVGNSTVKNCIIVGNAVSNEWVAAEVGGTSSSVSHSCLDTATEGTGNIVADPRFVDAANGDYRLAADSLCIDAGAAGYLDLPFDLDGNPRLRGRAIDMGCYEYQTIQTETWTTPVPVPFAWLGTNAPTALAAAGGDYEAAAKATAANGVNKVWECYVAGLSPTNTAERFEARVEFENGEPVVTWAPDLGAARDYVVEGKETLGDGWGPTNTASRFFRVKVSLPE